MTISALTVVACLAVWRLADHDLDRRNSEGFAFTLPDAAISGTLWLPDGAPAAAVVLVHGDGPQNRSAAGGYAPLINSLLDHDIAVASWDKPGIGASGGNWLHQSMPDRVSETRKALRLLDQRFQGVTIGAIGFSQAGWVLPWLTRQDADFLVLVGPAVSWRDQGDYYTRIRLARAGLDPQAIDDAIAAQNREDDRIFGPDARADHAPKGMSADRWRFIRQNRMVDARDALARLDLPLLAIWGADDLNVDAKGDAATYRQALTGSDSRSQIIIWPDATHGLLKARAYNWQLIEDWSWLARVRFAAEGRYAFAPGVLDTLTGWIKARSHDPDAAR